MTNEKSLAEFSVPLRDLLVDDSINLAMLTKRSDVSNRVSFQLPNVEFSSHRNQLLVDDRISQLTGNP